MKKLLPHFGLSQTAVKMEGESYRSLFSYFLPEFITCLLLYCVLGLFDSLMIAQLPNKAAYTTLGYTNTLFHLLTKLAEGFSVGMVIICGKYNGKQEHKNVGDAVTSGFWTTLIVGAVTSIVLYASAHAIYSFYQVPNHMIDLGIPFMRLRALGVFFNFVFFALVGFLRGIKNTKVPMILLLIGGAVFLFLDYALLFGKFGFPAMEFQGSALASVIQYMVMLLGALTYIFYDPELKVYGIRLFRKIQWNYVGKLLMLSWPVMLDKAALAVCQIWLSKQISVVALQHADIAIRTSFIAIKDIERFAIIPALALAQIITFLVSNDYRLNNVAAIKANVARVLIMSLSFVGAILVVVSLFPSIFLKFIDTDPEFIRFVAICIPVVSMLVIFDLMQLIISAALRGASHVRLVMITRIAVSALFFIPVSYFVSHAQFMSAYMQFIAVYGTIYIANGITCVVYLYWLTKYKLGQYVH